MSGVKPVLTLPWGELRLDVWPNQSKRGFLYYSYELSKSFKDQAGNWKKTHGLFESEIDHAITLLTEMKRRILIKKGKENPQDLEKGVAPFSQSVDSVREAERTQGAESEFDFPPLSEDDEVPF